MGKSFLFLIAMATISKVFLIPLYLTCFDRSRRAIKTLHKEKSRRAIKKAIKAVRRRWRLRASSGARSRERTAKEEGLP